MDYATKVKALLSLLISSLLAFYEPVIAFLLPILWLILLDILTGAYVVRVVDRKPLTSRGFFKKLPQVGMGLIALSAALHADPFFVEFGITKYQAAKLVLSFYGLYELFSILENLGKSGLPVAKQFARLLQAKLPDEVKKEFSDKP